MNPFTGQYRIRWLGSERAINEVTWQPGLEIAVTVSGSATIISADAGYEYRYAIESGATSRQNVRQFTVQCLSDSTLPGIPAGWDSRLLPEQVWHGKYWSWWGTEKGGLGMPPGTRVEGFSLCSGGLPTVAPCYATGPNGFTRISGEHELPDYIFDCLPPHNILQSALSGVTIGPGLDPSVEPPSPEDLLKKMEEYVTTSQQQHWICDPNVANQMKRWLEEVNVAVGAGSLGDAVGKLRRILDETERLNRQQPSAITSEAYALVRYNAEWIIGRLTDSENVSKAR